MSDSRLDDVLIYRSGSPFQRQAYAHAARYFHALGVRRYGVTRSGSRYGHLLHPEDSALNFLSPAIANAVASRFQSHKAGNRARAETNTVASQPCCFNLFVPLAQDLALASAVFSDVMGMPTVVDYVELEFTPNQLRALPGYELGNRDESLGDQRGSGGTDADLAIFYRAGGHRGVLLMEFKYIEAGFSTCGSYNSTDGRRRAVLRPLCGSSEFVAIVTEPRRDERGRRLCGYTRYQNWDLVVDSTVLDWTKIAALSACPFAGSGQQLWRNLLLAENVARQRRLQHFGFWVISPSDNVTLWQENRGDVFDTFMQLLRPGQQRRFHRLTTEAVLAAIDAHLDPSDERRRWWLDVFRERYLPRRSGDNG